MKLLSLITVVVLLQVSLISQAADVVIQEQSSPAQIQTSDQTNIMANVPAATSTDINSEISLQITGVEKLTKTDWGTTITKRKLHIRDGVFSLTLHSTKLYS